MSTQPVARTCLRCNLGRSQHSNVGTCPDGGGVFKRRPPHAAHSFMPDEVDLLADAVQALLLEPDEQHAVMCKLARRPALGRVAHKVAVLKATSKARKVAS